MYSIGEMYIRSHAWLGGGLVLLVSVGHDICVEKSLLFFGCMFEYYCCIYCTYVWCPVCEMQSAPRRHEATAEDEHCIRGVGSS